MFLGSPHAQCPRAPVGGSTHVASPLGWPVVSMPSRTASLPTLRAGTLGQPLTLGGLLPGVRDGRGLPPPPAPPRSITKPQFRGAQQMIIVGKLPGEPGPAPAPPPAQEAKPRGSPPQARHAQVHPRPSLGARGHTLPHKPGGTQA